MNIECYLLTEGKFETVILPEKLLIGLAKSLRTKGVETVHFAERSIEVEGIYIPSKGSKVGLMVIPNAED